MSLNLTDLGRDLTAGRKKNEELSSAARAAICGAVAGGVSKRAVAAAFGVSHIVVSKTIQRFTTTNSFDSKPGTGRLQVLTRKDKRYIVQLAKRNAWLTHQQLLKILGRKVSSSTVRRALPARLPKMESIKAHTTYKRRSKGLVYLCMSCVGVYRRSSWCELVNTSPL